MGSLQQPLHVSLVPCQSKTHELSRECAVRPCFKGPTLPPQSLFVCVLCHSVPWGRAVICVSLSACVCRVRRVFGVLAASSAACCMHVRWGAQISESSFYLISIYIPVASLRRGCGPAVHSRQQEMLPETAGQDAHRILAEKGRCHPPRQYRLRALKKISKEINFWLLLISLRGFATPKALVLSIFHTT